MTKEDGSIPAPENKRVVNYEGVTLKGAGGTVGTDRGKKKIMVKREGTERDEEAPVGIPVEKLTGIYIEERKRCPPTVLRVGLVMVLLIGAYLAIAEYITIGEKLEIALYINFFGLAVIGAGLIILYLILKEKVLVMEWNGGELVLKGPSDALGRLRLDVHTLSEGKMLREVEEGGDGDIKGDGKGDKYTAGISAPDKRKDGKDDDGWKTGKGGAGRKKGIRCPQCGSGRLYYEAGLMTGYKYHCKSCDYIGPFVIEMDR